MSQHEDEFLRRLERDQENLNRVSNQLTEKVVSAGAVGLRSLISANRPFQSGGTHIELFLRHNFGVGYFRPFFWFTTTVGLAAGIYFSSSVLFGSSAADPASVLWAASMLTGELLVLVPFTAHAISILSRFADTSGEHSQYPGDAWLDDLNVWLQGVRSPSAGLPKRIMAWVCADSLRRDFLGETVAGILVAYVIGWLCFNRYVTDFLLFSLAMTQLKRTVRILNAIREKRQWNDAQREMERRQAK
jgi:hypothetical protein